MDFRKQIIRILKKAGLDAEELNIESPKDESLGDYALPCFIFSKKGSPVEFAQELARKLTPNKYITEIKVVGPYINFFTNKSILAEELLKEISLKKNKFGVKKQGKKKIMVEFSSPNTNKPLHLGHMRNCFLGESVSRVQEALGSKVIRSCLVNDRGVHICKSMLAYKKWGKGKTPESAKRKGDHLVGDMYILYAKHEDDALKEEVQQMLQVWESNHAETVKLWKRMNSWVLKGFEETYRKMGISFDKYYFESDIYKKGKDIVRKGLKDKKLYDKDGATYAPLEKKKLPDKVVLRADGTSVYMTQDIYLAVKKFKDYKLDESLYVVGSEQNLHFRQLFAILDILGFRWAGHCHHLSYGMVYLPEGKMKSREGKVVDADDLLDEVKELARKEIGKREKKISKSELERRAGKIALAALKFFILRIDAQKDMTYNPEESISFEGETGPYVQYVAVRIKSILRKYGRSIPKNIDFSVYNEQEKKLIAKLSRYPNIVAEAGSGNKPSHICNYLIDLCQEFNTYYHRYQVLKEHNLAVKNARLLLISCIRQIIENALFLLGIELPEKM